MKLYRKKLVLIGGILNILWGIAHLFPAQSVVNGFGNITSDNKNIVLMEWISEGLTLIFLGVLVISITVYNNESSKTAKIVYLLVFIMLISMSILSLFTGFNIDFLPFKLCPAIFALSGLFILQGIFKNK